METKCCEKCNYTESNGNFTGFTDFCQNLSCECHISAPKENKEECEHHGWEKIRENPMLWRCMDCKTEREDPDIESPQTPDSKTYHEIEQILTDFKNGATYSDQIEKVEKLLAAAHSSGRREGIKEVLPWLKELLHTYQTDWSIHEVQAVPAIYISPEMALRNRADEIENKRIKEGLLSELIKLLDKDLT